MYLDLEYSCSFEYICTLTIEHSNTITLSGCSVARSSRLVWDEEVAGSNPATPTVKALHLQGFFYAVSGAYSEEPSEKRNAQSKRFWLGTVHQTTASQIFEFRNRKAFKSTETELKLIATAANMGESNHPKTGYKTPAAIGIPNVL